MRLTAKNGQYYVDQIGLEQPLIFPGTMDKQTIARAVMNRYGDQVRKFKAQERMMGGPPSPEQGFMLGMGRTGEMFSDFMSRPRLGTGSPERIAEYDRRAEMRAKTAPVLTQYQQGPFEYGGMTPYFAVPTGAASGPAAGLMRRLGVDRLPGMGRASDMVGRSVIADTAGQGAILGAASDDGGVVEGAAYGAGGGFLGKALSRALRPTDSVLDPVTAATLQRGEELGFTLTPAQATGSRALANVEDAMQHNILTGSGFDKIRERNQENANRIVGEALGFQGPRASYKITPAMIDRVSDNFDERFSELTQGKAVKIDNPRFWDTLARLEAETVDYPLYNKDFKAVIDDTVDLLAKGDGWLSGEQFKVLNTKITKGIRAGYKPNSGQADFAEELVQLKDALDEAAMESLGPDVLQRYRDTRADYKVFANLMKNSVINEDTGDVSLRMLGNVLRRDDRYGYRRGKNTSDLYDATRFARATVGDGVNSLTARRMSLPNVLTGSALLGAVGYGATGDEETGIGAAASIPASMLLFGRYYNSPAGRRHFGKGLLPPISDEFRRHLGQKVGLGAIAATQAQ